MESSALSFERQKLSSASAMPRVHIKTYGCQMNERDTEQVSQMFVERGYTMTGTDLDADVVLINTCSVRDRRSRRRWGRWAWCGGARCRW
jgi:hypothetical protein